MLKHIFFTIWQLKLIRYVLPESFALNSLCILGIWSQCGFKNTQSVSVCVLCFCFRRVKYTADCSGIHLNKLPSLPRDFHVLMGVLMQTCFFFNPASAASLISILNSANTEIKKEKVNSIQTCYYSTISILSSKTCCETLDIHYQDDMFFTLETGSFWPLSPRVGHCLHTLTV